MVRGDLTHVCMLIATFIWFVLGFFVMRKVGKRVQNVVFVLLTLFCSGGIFFRYAMGLRPTLHFQWQTLAMQLMQVCNFNFVLLPLMLVPKFELARQYSVMFSMLCAATPFFSPPSAWAGLPWYDLQVLNSWLNHTCAVSLPLFMVAARRLKPQKKYALPVTLAVFFYFTAVAIVSYPLIDFGILTADTSFSYVFKQDGILIFKWLYRLIPVPYFYLYPLLPVLYLLFRFFAWAMKNYRAIPFAWRVSCARLRTPSSNA